LSTRMPVFQKIGTIKAFCSLISAGTNQVLDES